MTEFKRVSSLMFLNNLEFAQTMSDTVRQSTSPVEEITDHDGVSYYLGTIEHDNDYCVNGAGFAIDKTGQLTSVFSLFRGQGKAIMTEAIKRGACHLDCFDGYLKGFYESFGFTVDKVVPNWTKGEPDVLFMSRK